MDEDPKKDKNLPADDFATDDFGDDAMGDFDDLEDFDDFDDGSLDDFDDGLLDDFDNELEEDIGAGSGDAHVLPAVPTAPQDPVSEGAAVEDGLLYDGSAEDYTAEPSNEAYESEEVYEESGGQDSEDGDVPEDEHVYDTEFEDLSDEDYDSDEDFDSDEEDEEWSEEAEAANLTKPKKSLGLDFNTMVIIGAVVVGLGVLAFQVMTTKPAGLPVENIRTSLSMTGSVDNPVLEEIPPEGTQQKQIDQEKPSQPVQGFLTNPGLLNELPDNKNKNQVESKTVEDAPPQPAPISTTLLQKEKFSEPKLAMREPETIPAIDITEPATILNATPGPLLVPSPAPAIEKPEVIELPKVVQKPPLKEPRLQPKENPEQVPLESVKQIEVKPQPVPAEIPPTVTKIVRVEAPATNTAALEKLSSQLGTIGDKMDQMGQRLSGIETRVSENERTSRAQLDKVTKSIESLEKKMAAAPAVSSAPLPKAPSPAPVKITKPPSQPQKATLPKATPKKATPPPKKVTPSPSAVRWVLRSAQPGRAWVSQNGNKAITMVQVGDFLPGIGDIKSVSNRTGTWVVVGTQGQIRQ